MHNRLRDILLIRKTGKVISTANRFDKNLGLYLNDRDYGGVETTATGNPVSIVTNKAQNAISTILSYSPKQSGSGDPSPQNIRPIEGWTEANAIRSRNSISDGLIEISPIQSGSGDPSPSNIRPITPGLTLQMDDSSTLEIYGATLNPVTGVLTNKVVLSVIDGTSDPRVANAGGVWFIDGFALVNYGTGLQTADSFTFTGQNYANVNTFKSQVSVGGFGGCSTSQNRARVFFRDKRFETTEDLQAYIAIHPVYVLQKLAQAQEIQLSQTELARALVALETMIYPISLGGTYYGFEIDVERGVLRVTHTTEVYDGTEEGWGEIGSDRGYYLRITGGSDYTRDILLISSHLKGVYTGSSASMPLNSIMLNANKTNLLCRVDTETDFPSLDSWKAFLAQNPMTVLFPLAEPTEITLTPQTVALLAGNNTLWTDGDSLSVTYKARG